jgi:hypothetical protein
MATLPSARTTVQDTAGAAASGLDNICIFAPVALNADHVPRLFGNAAALYAQHGFGEGLEYAAMHFEQTRKPVLFCGLPIATPGLVGREDTSGNSGTCVTTVAEGADGVLAEHDGEWSVIRGGTIGTSQILLGLSLDGGRTVKKIKLGTANSYADPYHGVVTTFGAGTLVAGETIHTWHGSAPLSDATAWAAARALLAAQMKGFRSILLVGDLQNTTEAAAYLAQLDAYETANERFVYGRCSVYDRLPQAALSVTTHRMTPGTSVTFAEVGGTGDTITRATGSWIADGFAVGDTITITGAISANNETGAVIAALSATVITLGSEDLDAEVTANATIVGRASLTFANSGETVTRNRGSWLADGFRVGDTVTITGTDSATNDGSFVITALSALVMTLAAGAVDADEVSPVSQVTVTTGQTKAAWAAELEDEFEDIDDAFRIDASMGRGAVLMPFSLWVKRVPPAWAASLREYQHDVHRATWRKKDGPTGFSLEDADGNLVEWDDRVDGGAASAARFTSFRTWANGPNGAFITLSLTRGNEGSLLSLTHNVAVLNLACTIVQLNTENAAIGESLVLNDDGTATKDSLAGIASQVNRELTNGLLKNTLGEGQRASKAVWTPSSDDVLNVPESILTGVLDLNLNGTVHSVRTTVRLRSGGS